MDKEAYPTKGLIQPAQDCCMSTRSVPFQEYLSKLIDNKEKELSNLRELQKALPVQMNQGAEQVLKTVFGV